MVARADAIIQPSLAPLIADMKHFQLQEADLLAAYWLHLRPGRWHKIIYLALAIVLAAEVAWAVWRYLDGQHGSKSLLLVTFAIIGNEIGLLGNIDIPGSGAWGCTVS